MGFMQVQLEQMSQARNKAVEREKKLQVELEAKGVEETKSGKSSEKEKAGEPTGKEEGEEDENKTKEEVEERPDNCMLIWSKG